MLHESWSWTLGSLAFLLVILLLYKIFSVKIPAKSFDDTIEYDRQVDPVFPNSEPLGKNFKVGSTHLNSKP